MNSTLNTTDFSYVISFLPSIDTMILLNFINKKVRHILTHIKIPPLFRLETILSSTQENVANSSIDFNNPFVEKVKIIRMLFKLFPQSEVAMLYGKELTSFGDGGNATLLMLSEYSNKQYIHVCGLPEDIDILDPIRKRIRSIESEICYYEDIHLCDYQNLEKCTLDFGNDAFDFSNIFQWVEPPLKFLRIKRFTDYDLLALILSDHPPFASTVVVDVDSSITNDQLSLLSSHATLVVDQEFYGMDSRIMVLNRPRNTFNVKGDYSSSSSFNDSFDSDSKLYFSQQFISSPQFHIQPDLPSTNSFECPTKEFQLSF
ncbi:F-box domain-containing protein [Entamoeba marina]